ncbi:transposase [Aphelenchoides avenae]|nr:transposase [Aphelenchus avenae]
MALNVWETNAKVPHSCTARDQHKVVGVGLARKVKKKVASGEMRASPSQAAVRLSTSVLQSFGNLDEGIKQQIRAAAMGTGRSLEKSLRRAKQKRFHTGLKRLAELTQEDFPDLWQSLRDAEAVVMASPRQLEWLRATKIIVCDGSFKYAPRNAYQVYRIFGFVADTHCVPLVTAILTGKSEEIYHKMWGAVANVLLDYMFDFALFDFEPASIAAFKRRFPETFAKMCAFHAFQAHNRRLQQLGLQTL